MPIPIIGSPLGGIPLDFIIQSSQIVSFCAGIAVGLAFVLAACVRY